MADESAPEDQSNRIDEELVCVDSLSHVLRTRCGCKAVHIKREAADPPDFTLTIDGETFPTEVTSIVTRQQYHAHCNELARAIRESARLRGELSGTYALTIFRLPGIPRTTSPHGRELIDAATAYISATKMCETAPESELAAEPKGKIRITKLYASGATVGVVWMAPAMWQVEVRNELVKLIQERVDDKQRRLAKAGIGAGKALLLLYAAYAYGDSEDALAALGQVKGCDWFHSIFWAACFADRQNTAYPTEPGREGLFLSSKNPEWKRVSSLGI